MEMRERIAKIIASEGLNSSAFADLLGIQRSNISHILNGRNGPSLELLQKILNTFPHYNTDWLVMGRGEIYKKPVQTSIFDSIEEPVTDSATDSISQEQEKMPDSMQQDQKQEGPGQVVDDSHVQMDSHVADIAPVMEQIVQRKSEVKQLVVLYSDNTFAIYNKQ